MQDNIVPFNHPWRGKPEAQQMNLDEANRLRIETAVREKGDFGKKKSRGITDDSELYMASEQEAPRVELPGGAFSLQPEIAQQISAIGSSLTGYSIMEEIESDRLTGKLRPFHEGEPIGKIQKHVRKPAPDYRTEADKYKARQEALNKLREKNDAAINAILNGR